ncbi:MATH domain and coiled-coil domain-containing protein At3g58250-like [Cornus florida]|uniref:MATH domain and coiled-coil domain-containing protein At3g58250-like n=1 Tax=Cornus florida TaxID=4283 RepID=UPI00289E5844|nr:MATH domain and coiled-coil domain-containing protein At3g58250-like [Cornus florida]
MEERSYHPIDSHNLTFEVSRSTRDIPPAHYTFKIESFSQLLQILIETGVENYESNTFEASGYKWKLSLYPSGDKERNGKGHISLYLVIAETNALPIGWEVNVNFKLFVLDQIQDKYMTIQDVNGKVRRFNRMKTEWGFAQLLPLSVFNDAANGYLIRDTCIFGAEVFVIKYTGRGEHLSLRNVCEGTFSWTVDKFSSLNDEVQTSKAFTLGSHQWNLSLYPKGDHRVKGSMLSLFIALQDLKTVQKIFVEFRFRLRDQLHGNHVESKGKKWFTASVRTWGYPSFLSLQDVTDDSKGFLVNDTLIIEADIIRMFAVENLS